MEVMKNLDLEVDEVYRFCGLNPDAPQKKPVDRQLSDFKLEHNFPTRFKKYDLKFSANSSEQD